MTTPTESVTQGLLRMALDGAALRHQAIAANIANANTSGYVPVKVDFEAEMGRARDQLQAGTDVDSVQAGAEWQLSADERGEDAAGVDDQAAALAQNVVHYQALLKGLSKRMAIMGMAINEAGRR